MVGIYREHPRRFHFIGNVDEAGYALGPFWVAGGYSSASSFTNGFFYGPLDHVGKMSGKGDIVADKQCQKNFFADKEAVFVFPDMKSVYVGVFKENVMISARAGKIVAERCKNNVKEIKVRC